MIGDQYLQVRAQLGTALFSALLQPRARAPTRGATCCRPCTTCGVTIGASRFFRGGFGEWRNRASPPRSTRSSAASSSRWKRRPSPTKSTSTNTGPKRARHGSTSSLSSITRRRSCCGILTLSIHPQAASSPTSMSPSSTRCCRMPTWCCSSFRSRIPGPPPAAIFSPTSVPNPPRNVLFILQ